MKRLPPRSSSSGSSPADGLRSKPGAEIDMIINPTDPPEHSGDCAYYPIPSTGVGHLDRRRKTAAVLGAGPGGLTAALTIKEEGYENVIVFEKRSVFSRMNVVNLHPESLHIFERLNIVDRFLERASLIIDSAITSSRTAWSSSISAIKVTEWTSILTTRSMSTT
jgi:hypothetical protein